MDETATSTDHDARIEQHLATVARSVHGRLLNELDDRKGAISPQRRRAVARDAAPLCSELELDRLVALVDEQLYGLGPLDPLLDDQSITEIMVNGPGPVWIERAGDVEPSGVTLSESDVRLVVDRVVGPLGLRLDRLLPFADARLSDGSRVHVTIPPMALDGPYVTIRRFATEALPLEAFGTPAVVDLLLTALERRANVLVSGGTGAGKTSLLNALGNHLPNHERIVSIEDAAELRLPGDHVVRLEARPPTAEGLGEITIRSLTRNALRMRPDRLVVGEVRGAEAFDMIQAMRTGHDGCLTTCHANGPEDALGRVVTMAMMSNAGLPVDMLQDQVMDALDLVVHVARHDRGARGVEMVLALSDVDGEPPRRLAEQGDVNGAGRQWLDVGQRHG